MAVNIQGLRGALARYRVFAYITGVLLAFMTVVGLPYKYLFDGDAAWYSLGWVAHGWVYILYVMTALDLVFRLRWSLWRALGVVLAGTIPFMSFVAERKVSRAVEGIVTKAERADTDAAAPVADASRA